MLYTKTKKQKKRKTMAPSSKKNRRTRRRMPARSSRLANSSASSASSSVAAFQKEITIAFLEMLMMVKLFHWKTTSFAVHKATDELYSSFNENIDHFIEVLLGKTGERTNLTRVSAISLIDLTSPEELKSKIIHFKKYLAQLNHNQVLNSFENTDLFNIRDEMLGNLNKFIYLLSLS